MSDMSFTWNGVSSDRHGIVVRSLPPIYTPQPRDEAVQVPGRDGALHRQDGAYEEQLMVVEGYLPYEQGVFVSPIEEIKSWLRGAGELTLSDRPNRRYRARIIEGIAFSQWVVGYQDRIFSVSFWADPFAYDALEVETPLNAPFTFVNPSGINAKPIITIKGVGGVVLRVGEVSVTLTDVTGSVTLDCEAKVAYTNSSTTPVAITLNDEVWPELGAGGTRVAWIGNVRQVVVKPNWRYW